jgi:serine phosphatase RsbU (regulator of sigma subunit)/ActR/RegA family two-component response regulator
MRVLVVDDSATQSKQLQLILASAGFEVEACVNGEQALARLRAERCDLVMSDVLMPGISGYELCEAIKKDPRLRHLPVILLTMLHDADDIMRGLASGADNFITKPYEPEVLLERISTVFANRRAGERGSNQFHFLGRAYQVSSAPEQILTFLTSTFEDYARGRQREKQAARTDLENRRKAAEVLARKNDELVAVNVKLEEVNASLDVARHRLEASYGDLQKEQALREIELRRMEVELTTARTVQSMLIPSRPPRDIPGVELACSYRPAMETGGDWFGFVHDVEARELSIMIGDVMGHGVASALLTAGVCSFVSATTYLRPPGTRFDLAETLSALNRVILDMGRKELPMTFFASRLDYTSRVLTYVSAGHPNPFLLRRSQLTDDIAVDVRRNVVTLPSRSSQLGMSEDVHFDVRTMQLEVGDLLIWYTDGATENTNPQGKPIHERQLLRWVRELYASPMSIEEMGAALEAKLLEFLGGRKPDDDMAFILARIV